MRGSGDTVRRSGGRPNKADEPSQNADRADRMPGGKIPYPPIARHIQAGRGFRPSPLFVAARPAFGLRIRSAMARRRLFCRRGRGSIPVQPLDKQAMLM